MGVKITIKVNVKGIEITMRFIVWKYLGKEGEE